ncbi:hypothetical protein [Nguyenibacter sp. L1]|uniref:hypothetical protein n=1 Tax=Nguyenibacter sp. L1 TaxID=3049350 RepID=UPI002B49BB81|nr:hypothetical protein [Nguyenibacter sp. L1]WRH89030.1 hypothetical protein QN315_05230 [Nguyenibacter sp. L1]
MTLLALALGSFCIGTSEFASMGIIQLFAAQLRISIPDATNACRRLVKDDERYATTLAAFHVIALVGYMFKHATQMIQCA